ncbi:MAG TPA: TRAP transporter substrate-binding protein DctP [Spirochaetales bacterium]|nr:TRAP transporter substrate-binding protein DctP [Spirochaetales bacterium]
MKKIKGIVVLLLLIVSAALCAQQPIVFKLAFTDPPYLKIGDLQVLHHSVAGMVAFKAAVENMTQKRVVVENYYYGRLGDANENLRQILTGTLQGATPADGAVAPFYAGIQVFSIPYLFKNPLDAYNLWDGPVGKEIFEDMAKKSGLRVLAIYDNGGFRSFSNNRKVVQNASDMRGLKIRTMTIPVHMELVKALGAAPTPIAWLELYNALQTGVVDGQENSAATILGGSLQEVQKYYTLDEHFLGSAMIVTGEKWLRSLPPDIQDAIIKAGKIAEFAARGTSRANDSLALEEIMKRGVQVYFPTPSEKKSFSNAAQTPVIEWLKKNVDPLLVDKVLSAVR